MLIFWHKFGKKFASKIFTLINYHTVNDQNGKNSILPFQNLMIFLETTIDKKEF